MLPSFIIFISIIIIIGLVLYTNEGYIMTLGDYGKPNPSFCDETMPVSGICNACKLECGLFEYKKNCEKCENSM